MRTWTVRGHYSDGDTVTVPHLDIVPCLGRGPLQRQDHLELGREQVLGRHRPQRRALVNPERGLGAWVGTVASAAPGHLWESTMGQYIWEKSCVPSRSVPNSME